MDRWSGSKAIKPATDPVRSGYRVTGWYELNSSQPFNFTQTAITADLTLYAGWKKVYTVTYHKNSGESGSVPATAVYDSGAAVTIAGNTGNLSKEGYTFIGWTTTPDGSGAVVTSISSIKADIDLYPKWEIKTFIVTFRDGSWFESRIVNYNSIIQNCPILNDKADKTFEGWSDTNICSKPITASTTVYAIWKEKPIYTVTFHSVVNDIPDETITVREGDLVPNHSKIGYGECWYICGYDRGEYMQITIYCGWFTGPTIDSWGDIQQGTFVSPNQRVYSNLDFYMHYRNVKILDHPDWGEGCSDYHHHTPSEVQ